MSIIHVYFITSLFFITVYFFIILRIRQGWNHLPEDSNLQLKKKVKISVIIAIRNDNSTIPYLIEDFKLQTYPKSMFDIILVDDHSDHPIAEIPEIKQDKPGNLRLASLPEDKFGKKQALLHGAQLSNAELILLTDADCRLHPDWIKCHAAKYSNEQSDITIGLVDYTIKTGLMNIFYRFDLLSLVISGAGSSALGRHTLCNGANLAVKRKIYLNLAENLRLEIPSGDDVFLLHEIKKNDGESVSLLKSRQSVVLTRPPASFSEFLSQRARWASKGKYYEDRDTLILSFLVLITNLVIASVLLYLFLSPTRMWSLVSLILIKMFADGIILNSGLKFFGKSKQLYLLPVFEIVYPFYVIFSALAGTNDSYTWKSRRR